MARILPRPGCIDLVEVQADAATLGADQDQLADRPAHIHGRHVHPPDELGRAGAGTQKALVKDPQAWLGGLEILRSALVPLCHARQSLLARLFRIDRRLDGQRQIDGHLSVDGVQVTVGIGVDDQLPTQDRNALEGLLVTDRNPAIASLLGSDGRKLLRRISQTKFRAKSLGQRHGRIRRAGGGRYPKRLGGQGSPVWRTDKTEFTRLSIGLSFNAISLLGGSSGKLQTGKYDRQNGDHRKNPQETATDEHGILPSKIRLSPTTLIEVVVFIE